MPSKELTEEYILNYLHIKELDLQADAAKARNREIEAGLIEQMVNEGLASVKVVLPGIRAHTLSLGEALYARVLTPALPDDATDQMAEAAKTEYRAKLVAALKAHPDFTDMVKEDINLNSLTARLKEWRREHQPIPEDLAPYIDFNPVPKITITKGSKQNGK